MTYSLGIDLGTTFVAAAVARPIAVEISALGDRAVVAPAVVYVREDGLVITGEAAERRAASHPDRAAREVKRRLGDPTPIMLGDRPYRATSLLGAQLREVVRKVIATEGGRPERVVLTHPVSWGPFRRELFEEVPLAAGLSAPQLVTEPEAAAAYYAASGKLDDGEIVAVYDLGGSTFDATVVRRQAGHLEILGRPEGLETLGGVDFDEAILSYVNSTTGGALAELDMADARTSVALARLRQDCVQAKEALSVDSEAVIPVFLPGQQFEIRLNRAAFEAMVRAPIESTIETLSRAVRSAGLTMSDLSSVLLVGGSSRIPLIAQMLSQAFGRPTLADAHPKYPVALGAALIAAASVPAVRRGGHDAVIPRVFVAGVRADPSVANGPVTIAPGSLRGLGNAHDSRSPMVDAVPGEARGRPAAVGNAGGSGAGQAAAIGSGARTSPNSRNRSAEMANPTVTEPPTTLIRYPRSRIGRVTLSAAAAVAVLLIALAYLLVSGRPENAPAVSDRTLFPVPPSVSSAPTLPTTRPTT